VQPPLVAEPEDTPVEAELDSVDKSVEADLASLFESYVATETIPFELGDCTELICLQQSDTSLSSLFELADKGDDHYFIKSGVLLRTWRDKLAPTESSLHQIVVPASMHLKLLQIAHEIPAAGTNCREYLILNMRVLCPHAQTFKVSWMHNRTAKCWPTNPLTH